MMFKPILLIARQTQFHKLPSLETDTRHRIRKPQVDQADLVYGVWNLRAGVVVVYLGISLF